MTPGSRYVTDHCNVNLDHDLVFFSEGVAGHRLSWLNILGGKARASGKRIHLVLLNHNISLGNREYLSSVHDGVFCLHLVVGGRQELVSQVKYLRSIYPRLIISTADADDWLPLLLPLRTYLRVIFMRPYLQSRSLFGVSRYLVKLMCAYFLELQKSTAVGLLSIPRDEHFFLKKLWVDDVESDYEDMTKVVLDSKFSLRAKFNLDPDEKIILVPGFISSRKNHELAVLSLKEALTNIPNQRVVLIFAGQASQSVALEIVNREDEGIYLLNEYLEKSHYFKSILDCDSILLLYSNRGSSGIVIDALSCNRNIIIAGGRRWSNLADHYDGLFQKVSPNLNSITEAVQIALVNSPVSHDGNKWRSNSQTVVEFVLHGS